MKKLFIFFVLIFLFLTSYNSFSMPIIREENGNYVVKSVRAEGASFENEAETKKQALENAKQIAFNEIMKKMNIEDVPVSEININSCISSFSIVDEYYSGSFYSIMVDFVFNKQITLSIANRSKQNIHNKGEIVNCIVVLKEQNNIIKEYNKLRNHLNTKKIKFNPIQIQAKEVSIKIFNVVEDDIYSSLKSLGLNGKIYTD